MSQGFYFALFYSGHIYCPSNFLIFCLKEALINFGSFCLRILLFDFFLFKWELYACPLIILPVLVNLKRLITVLLFFFFMIYFFCLILKLIFRPMSFISESFSPSSDKIFTAFSKTLWPNSGWVISLPPNLTVNLTLSPFFKNDLAWYIRLLRS